MSVRIEDDWLRPLLDTLMDNYSTDDWEDVASKIRQHEAKEVAEARIDELMAARNMVEATWKTTEMIKWFVQRISRIRSYLTAQTQPVGGGEDA